MPKEDYYAVLGVPKYASDRQIHDGYRKAALKYNPIRRKSLQALVPSQKGPAVRNENVVAAEAAEEQKLHLECSKRFLRLGEAYEVLRNRLLRTIYDAYGEIGLKKGVPGPQGFIPPYVYHEDPFKTFREFFKTDNPFIDLVLGSCTPINNLVGDHLKGGKVKDAPVFRDLLLSLEECYSGTVKKVAICRKIFKDSHPGTEQKILTIAVEPGTIAGKQYIIQNVGDEGQDFEPGDMHFVTKVKKHPFYTREKDNLIYRVQVNVSEMLSGITIPILTLDDRYFIVNIVHYITPNYEKIIAGEGFPNVDKPGMKGDLIIRFDVTKPARMTQKYKDTLKQAMGCGPDKGSIPKEPRQQQQKQQQSSSPAIAKGFERPVDP